MTHTPGPWTAHTVLGTVQYNYATKKIMGFHCGAFDIATMKDIPQQDEVAAFIVRACNSHEAMLEALKQTRLNALAPVATDWGVVVERLDEAIRLAEGRG